MVGAPGLRDGSTCQHCYRKHISVSDFSHYGHHSQALQLEGRWGCLGGFITEGSQPPAVAHCFPRCYTETLRLEAEGSEGVHISRVA